MSSKKTQLNAVFGLPIDHSLSPVLHTQIYKDNNIDAALLAFACSDIARAMQAMRNLPIHLAAVTMPHKLAVMEHLDEIDDVAKKIKAVNTVINRNGKLYGYNTDIIGVAKSLETTEIKNKKVLLIGAGGAARTVACYLQQVGGIPLYLNRTKKDAQVLADEFGGQVVDLEELEAKEIDIIVNATPVGMYPSIDKMPISEKYLFKHQIVMDIVYNPIRTKLLETATAKGAKIVSGLEMFVGQALGQVELWREKEIKNNNYNKFLEKYLNK